MRTRHKQRVATDTWRSLGCRTTPLEHWSKRKPTVEPGGPSNRQKSFGPKPASGLCRVLRRWYWYCSYFSFFVPRYWPFSYRVLVSYCFVHCLICVLNKNWSIRLSLFCLCAMVSCMFPHVYSSRRLTVDGR